MLANIGNREVIGAQDVQILECKTAGINGSRLWKEGVPEYVQLQVQHQLVVTGKAAADVAVLLGGQHLEIHRIHRDEALIARLIQLEAAFWRYVETDTPPPADGSESAEQALRCLYPQDKGIAVDFSTDRNLSATFAGFWISVRQTLAETEKLESKLKQTLQQAMGEASRHLRNRRSHLEEAEPAWCSIRRSCWLIGRICLPATECNAKGHAGLSRPESSPKSQRSNRNPSLLIGNRIDIQRR